MNRQHSRGFRFRKIGLRRQGSRLGWIAAAALGVAAGAWSAPAGDPIQKGEMAGYLLVPNERVPETYNAGFSMYVTAWPLLDQYPEQRFQTGLFGTWMFARKDPPPPIKLYSDVEGGLGWWRDTEYATETPKFISWKKDRDYGDDPATAPMLKMIRGADGKPTVCEGAWISYLTGANEKNFELNGKLTAGYGSMWGLAPTKPGNKIGPEFTFGLTMDAALDGLVLIIKAAWGGKSLHTDFRSPGAGPYQPSSFQRENYPKQEGHGIPKDFEQWKADKAKATGHYYHLMIGHVREVLDDVKRVYPDYAKDRNYLAPPDVGTLAHLDPALILMPPRGIEPGYVPIATRQELETPR